MFCGLDGLDVTALGVGFTVLWGFRGLEVETLEGFDCYAIALAAPSR